MNMYVSNGVIMKTKKLYERKCEICGNTDYLVGKIRSMRCKACLGKSGLRRIQGLREKANTNGYIMINVGGKRYYEHRLVMQLHLNRPLLDSEHVHHINGNKIDNRLENLEIMLKSDHHKLHSNPEKMKKMSIMAHKIKRIKNAPNL